VPSRLIELPLSSEPLFEAAATFLCVLAYPESVLAQLEDGVVRADRFRTAAIRKHICWQAQADPEFAARPAPIRPRYYSDLSDARADEEWARGMRRLEDRQEAALATFPLFERALSGRPPDTLRGLGTTAKNNVHGRAEMVMYWRQKHKNNIGLDQDSLVSRRISRAECLTRRGRSFTPPLRSGVE
jgi:hypothetical protein